MPKYDSQISGSTKTINLLPMCYCNREDFQLMVYPSVVFWFFTFSYCVSFVRRSIYDDICSVPVRYSVN